MHKYVIGLMPLLWPLSSLAHGISEEAKSAMISGGHLQYLWLGTRTNYCTSIHALNYDEAKKTAAIW